MGAAYDYSGNVIGEYVGDSETEVMTELRRRHPDAAEIRVRHGESPVVAQQRHDKALMQAARKRRNRRRDALAKASRRRNRQG